MSSGLSPRSAAAETERYRLFVNLVDPNSGIAFKSHHKGLRSIKRSFTGKELVDWFIGRGFAPTREAAVFIAQKDLFDTGYFEQPSGEFQLFDDSTIYTLTLESAPLYEAAKAGDEIASKPSPKLTPKKIPRTKSSQSAGSGSSVTPREDVKSSNSSSTPKTSHAKGELIDYNDDSLSEVEEDDADSPRDSVTRKRSILQKTSTRGFFTSDESGQFTFKTVSLSQAQSKRKIKSSQDLAVDSREETTVTEGATDTSSSLADASKKSRKSSKKEIDVKKRKDKAEKVVTPRAGLTYDTDSASCEEIALIFGSEAQTWPRVHILALAHEHFVNTDVLARAFIKHFKTSDFQVQGRIIRVLRRWINLTWDYMGVNGRKEFQAFAAWLAETKNPLLNFLGALEASRATSRAIQEPVPPPPQIPRLKGLKPGYPEILAYEPEEIARQITLLDHQRLKSVDLRELLRTRWTRGKAPYLTEMADALNRLTFWMALEILQPQLKLRVKVVAHIISVGLSLLALKNYHSLMAVFLSLQLPAISRLSKTWKTLPQKYITSWLRIKQVMSPLDNFQEYRKLVRQIDSPTILSNEVTLKDLLYQCEGSPDVFEADGRINFRKMDTLGKILDDFHTTQVCEYSLEPYQILMDFLTNIPLNIYMDKLMSASETVEPPEMTTPRGTSPRSYTLSRVEADESGPDTTPNTPHNRDRDEEDSTAFSRNDAESVSEMDSGLKPPNPRLKGHRSQSMGGALEHSNVQSSSHASHSANSTPTGGRHKSSRQGRHKNGPVREHSVDSMELSESKEGKAKKPRKSKASEAEKSEVSSSDQKSNLEKVPEDKVISVQTNSAGSAAVTPSSSTRRRRTSKTVKTPTESGDDSESLKTEAVVTQPGQVKSENIELSNSQSSEPVEAKEVRIARAKAKEKKAEREKSNELSS